MHKNQDELKKIILSKGCYDNEENLRIYNKFLKIGLIIIFIFIINLKLRTL